MSPAAGWQGRLAKSIWKVLMRVTGHLEVSGTMNGALTGQTCHPYSAFPIDYPGALGCPQFLVENSRVLIKAQVLSGNLNVASNRVNCSAGTRAPLRSSR